MQLPGKRNSCVSIKGAVKGLNFLGNILWFVFGGFIAAAGWFFVGLLWCITIIGIPVGVQCFKFAGLSLWPFGREVENGGGTGSTIINLIWLLLGGIELAIMHAVIGGLLFITIIGIPFARQHFKLAMLALMPVGSRVVRGN